MAQGQGAPGKHVRGGRHHGHARPRNRTEDRCGRGGRSALRGNGGVRKLSRAGNGSHRGRGGSAAAVVTVRGSRARGRRPVAGARASGRGELLRDGGGTTARSDAARASSELMAGSRDERPPLTVPKTGNAI